MTGYRVTHRTAYSYEDEVSASYGQLHLLPRDGAGQVIRSTKVVIDPAPDDYSERTDFFGNRVAFYAIHSDHRALTVTTTTELSVATRKAALTLLGEQPWEQARDAIALGGTAAPLARGGPSENGWEAAEFLLDSPLVESSPELAGYARPSFPAGRSVLDALGDLAARIHRDFEYAPGATSVTTGAGEVLVAGKGVCQDFAHLAVGCLRSIGFAARYVSGYLETVPPPGRQRLRGVDVSHAWASAWVPGTGWVDLDPTNRQLVDDRYVTAACGRDYSDVPPLKGVIFTRGLEHELEVSVDVVRVELPPSG